MVISTLLRDLLICGFCFFVFDFMVSVNLLEIFLLEFKNDVQETKFRANISFPGTLWNSICVRLMLKPEIWKLASLLPRVKTCCQEYGILNK